MKDRKITNDNYSVFYSKFRNYYFYRWGLMPDIPTHLDNSNSIYQLLAWLQRAFLNLMNDFLELEADWEEFKKMLIEFLEKVIPEIINNYVHSDEFYEIIQNIVNELLKPIIERIEKLEKTVEIQGDAIQKIINNLYESGAINSNDINNFEFNKGRNIATGNINVFSGKMYGDKFIRTNKNTQANGDGDIASGVSN